MLTSALGTTLGWFLCLVIAYVISDTDSILQSDLGQPFIAVLAQALPIKTATAFGAITIISGVSGAEGCAVAASRLAFAYGRDGLLPASKYVGQVHRHTRTPINAAIFNFVVQVAMLCLIFAGPLAVGAIFSISAVGNYFAFAMPIVMRHFFAGPRWQPGPWTLGRYSLPLNYGAIAFVAVMIPILCFPTVKGADLNAKTMNWTIVVWGGPLFLASVFFGLSARKTYHGPKINQEQFGITSGSSRSVLKV